MAAGKLKPQKGFDLLLEAMSLLPDEYALTVLGEGPDRAALEARAQALGLAPGPGRDMGGRVTFAGFAANPYPAMAGADMFVLSSRFEGFPNVVLEAMACGTPVAAFACPGGLDEIVLPGVNGLLAAPGDPAALARAIRDLAASPTDPDTVRASVADRFGVADMVARYADLLVEAASVSVLRVVHVITGLGTGGAENMLANLVTGTDRAAFESRVVSLLEPGPLAGRIRDAGVAVESLGMRRGAPGPGALWRLASALRRGQAPRGPGPGSTTPTSWACWPPGWPADFPPGTARWPGTCAVRTWTSPPRVA